MADPQSSCIGILVFLVLLLLFNSFENVSPTEMALKYNWFLRTVSPAVINEPGFKFKGPFVKYLKYPKTIQTMEYDDRHRSLLDGRTSDGLPLILGIAFQYQLLPDQLFQLYHEYEHNYGDYIEIFRIVGIHMITELATEHSAYEFFNEKQKIALNMTLTLNNYFTKHLHATVQSLQINEDDLPPAFTDAVLKAATCKQNISTMEKTKDAKKVEFTTARLVAEAQANVTIQQATGEVHRILQNANADAAIIEAYTQAEKLAYGRVKEGMGINGEQLIEYMYYDMLGGGGVTAQGQKDISVLVGVNPSAYINQK